jgi:hypothetical protein
VDSGRQQDGTDTGSGGQEPHVPASPDDQDGGPGSHTEDGTGGTRNDTASGGVSGEPEPDPADGTTSS